jgi:hypothetical protein
MISGVLQGVSLAFIASAHSSGCSSVCLNTHDDARRSYSSLVGFARRAAEHALRGMAAHTRATN